MTLFHAIQIDQSNIDASIVLVHLLRVMVEAAQLLQQSLKECPLTKSLLLEMNQFPDEIKYGVYTLIR